MIRVCPHCLGDGKVTIHSKTRDCPTCDGAGKVAGGNYQALTPLEKFVKHNLPITYKLTIERIYDNAPQKQFPSRARAHRDPNQRRNRAARAARGRQ